MRTAILAAALAAVALPAAAQVYIPAPQQCSSSMLSSVIGGMPTGTNDLDPRLLTCAGLADVYFIQVDPEMRSGEQRRRIEAVFRREGLIR